MKRMKQWASALLALLLLFSLSAPAALAAEPVYREAKSDVNIRKGAGTQFDVVTTVPKGDVVVVTSMWYQEWWGVKYTNADGKVYEGYIKSEYLKETSKRKNEKKNTAPLGCYRTLLELNLRSGPGTGYKSKAAVPKGNVVNVTDTTDENWYGCTFINSKGTKYTGYLSAKWLTKAPEPYNVKSKTQLRKSASSSSRNLQTLPKGSYLFVTAVYSSKWFKVEYTSIDGQLLTGYVLRSKVKKGTVTNKPYKQVDPEAEAKWMAEQWRTKTRYTLTAKTNLTKTAKKKGKKVATLSKGAVVAVAGSSGKFYKVVWNNSSNQKKTGYLPKNKLKKLKDPNGGDYVTKVDTQLRKTDSKTGDVLAELSEHTMFTVKDTSEKDWLWAVYTDKNGTKHTGFVRKSHAEKYVEKNAGDYCAKVETDLRETASSTGEEIQTIPEGSLVKVTQTYNPSWYYATYKDEKGKNHKGYVKASHLRKFQSLKQDYVAYVDTELRHQPSSRAREVLAEISEGQAVVVNDTPVSGWYWVTYKDVDGTKYTGFVNASHLQTREEYNAAHQPEDPQPENPQPENPENPQPENPQPENPENPQPENPQPEQPENNQTEQTGDSQTEQPQQENQNPGTQSADESADAESAAALTPEQEPVLTATENPDQSAEEAPENIADAA